MSQDFTTAVRERAFLPLDMFTAVRVILVAMAVVILILVAIKLCNCLVKKFSDKRSAPNFVANAKLELADQVDEDAEKNDEQDEVKETKF